MSDREVAVWTLPTSRALYIIPEADMTILRELAAASLPDYDDEAAEVCARCENYRITDVAGRLDVCPDCDWCEQDDDDRRDR